MKTVTTQGVYLEIPTSDMELLNGLAKRFGWKRESKYELLENFISSRPKDVDLSDEDIMEELRAVRYKG